MFKLQHTKFICCIFMLLLAGCPPKFTDILQKKADYKQVQAKFSAEIFFNAEKQDRRILVQVRNLTCPQFSEKIEKSFLAAFKAQNFKIVTDPIQAGFLLQANIVQCNKNEAEASQHTLENGYAGAVEQSADLPVQLPTEELDENIIVSIIADLQISERISASSNSSSDLVAKKLAPKPWKKYQTRLAVTKPQLRGRDFNSSIAWLIDGMAITVVEIFGK